VAESSQQEELWVAIAVIDAFVNHKAGFKQ
jgi:hypothetical protein